MKNFGIDFTSAPTRRKTITVAEAQLSDRVLAVANVRGMNSFEQLSEFLTQPGPWLAAIDFPFGQPRKLVLESLWPASWLGYVDYVQGMGKERFVEYLRQYRDPTTGKRRLWRETDKIAGSRSPMQVDWIPVGRMFFVGAPLLAKSPCAIVPFRSGQVGAGTIVEGYPKLVAEKAVGKASYKSDYPSPKRPAQFEVRNRILQWICGKEARQCYGFTVQLKGMLVDECLNDPSADKLDAVLCAMQAAWAGIRHREGYGVPGDCDELEGWIVDPRMLEHRPRQAKTAAMTAIPADRIEA